MGPAQQGAGRCRADVAFGHLAHISERLLTRQFRTGGIRVRAWPTPAEAIADGHPDNAYADMILRMGAGRSADVKRAAGDALMKVAVDFFAGELARPHFALALEIVEIDSDFSWKTNSIHPRMNREQP